MTFNKIIYTQQCKCNHNFFMDLLVISKKEKLKIINIENLFKFAI